MGLTAPPSSSELVPQQWDGRVWGWYRLSVRVSDHWIRQEPRPQAATLLLRYPRIRPVRGHGSVLLDDGFLAALCVLSVLLCLLCCSQFGRLVFIKKLSILL